MAAINSKFHELMTARDEATVEAYLNDVILDNELITDVRSNLDQDRGMVYSSIIEPKLSKRYSGYVIDHAIDRYDTLMNGDIAAFVTRNAYHLPRQAAIGMGAYR